MVMIIFMWVLPIGLFFYRPQVKRNAEEQWPEIPYEDLKFGKKIEMVVITAVCVGIPWLMYYGIKIGALTWK